MVSIGSGIPANSILIHTNSIFWHNMTTRTYFLPPDFLSYPAAQPSNPGPIRLGQLIADISDPGHTVGTLSPLDMTGYDMPIGTVDARGMGHTDNSTSSFYVDAFLKAIELVGLKFNTRVQNSKNLLSAIEEIKAQTIDPKDSYVKASMQREEVQAWLKQSRSLRRVFMVCGILIARPQGDKSTISISTEQSLETSGSAEGYGTAAQVPLGGGTAAGGTFSKEFGLAFVPKTQFIYGFRLRECFFKRGQGTSKAYYKGAKLHAKGQASEDVEEDSSFDFSGVATKDLGFDALGEAEDNFQEVSMSNEAENTARSLIAPKAK